MMYRPNGFVVLSVLALLFFGCAPAAQPVATLAPTAVAPTPTLGPVTPGPVPTATPTLAPKAPTPTAGPKMGGILTWSPEGEPSQPDPHSSTRQDVYHNLSYVHTRLLRYNFSQEGCGATPLEPELATKWEWRDGNILEVTLRSGVKFPPKPPVNGREMTADDVVYVVTKQWPKTSQLAGALAPLLKSIQAPGKYMVRFELKAPSLEFPAAVLASPYSLITPREVFSPAGNIEKVEDNIGLGPYMIKRFVPGVRFDLERNPNYFRAGLPRPDGQINWIMPDIMTRIAAFRAGRLDFVWPIDSARLVEDVKKRAAPGTTIVGCPRVSPEVLSMRVDKTPFSDVRVRRAIAMAIDRDVVNRMAFLGTALPAWTSVGPDLPGYMDRKDFPPEVRQYLEYNPERSKQLLAEAGYPNGFETFITQSGAYPVHIPAAEVVVDMLVKVGIKASIRMVERTEYAETVYTGKHPQMAIAWMHSGSTLDNALAQNFYSAGGINQSAVRDKEWDRLVDEWRAATDPQRAAELVRTMLIRQVDQAWYTPLVTPLAFLVAQPNVHVPVYKTVSKSDADWAMWMWKD